MKEQDNIYSGRRILSGGTKERDFVKHDLCQRDS